MHASMFTLLPLQDTSSLDRVWVVYEHCQQTHLKYTIQAALFSHILPTVTENWEFTGTDNLLWVRCLIASPTKTSAPHSYNCYNPFPLVPGVGPSCTLQFLFLKDADAGKSAITFQAPDTHCLAPADQNVLSRGRTAVLGMQAWFPAPGSDAWGVSDHRLTPGSGGAGPASSWNTWQLGGHEAGEKDPW